MATEPGYLPVLQSRADYVDYLEGHTQTTVDELQARKLSRKLLKTYMLETVGHSTAVPPIDQVFTNGVHLERLDDSLYRVHDVGHDNQVVGLVEEWNKRHPVFYTNMQSDVSNKWVREKVDTNPWLDRLWLSSHILFELWHYVERFTPIHRYVRLGFEHEAHYESSAILDVSDSEDTDDQHSDESVDKEDQGHQRERRRSRIYLTEQLGVLQNKLPHFLELYDPIHSLVQLLIPSPGRGGNHFYHNGQVTNRSASFADHRATVGLVLDLYRQITERAERNLWFETTDVDGGGYTIAGSPLLIQFANSLNAETFGRFVELGLQRKTSRFRIGGYVTWHGPTKVHMVAFDRHLWQPILLEATHSQILALLPSGTCGNTIHRLITNTQRFLSPNVEVWLGNELYSEAVTTSMHTGA